MKVCHSASRAPLVWARAWAATSRSQSAAPANWSGIWPSHWVISWVSSAAICWAFASSSCSIVSSSPPSANTCWRNAILVSAHWPSWSAAPSRVWRASPFSDSMSCAPCSTDSLTASIAQVYEASGTNHGASIDAGSIFIPRTLSAIPWMTCSSWPPWSANDCTQALTP